MNKLSLILLLSCALSLKSYAQEQSYPRFTYGVEWSYISTLHSTWHYNFFSPEGYRMNTRGSETMYRSNGEAYVNAGYNFDENWNLSLYIGLTGLNDLHKAVPVTLRGTYYFGCNPLSDRWFSYMEAGSGISLKLPSQEIFACKAGGGYRISLSRNTKIDFMLAVKVTYTHPDIFYDQVKIDFNKINKNGMALTSIALGMGVRF